MRNLVKKIKAAIKPNICQGFDGFIDDYLDGELSAPKRLRFAFHISRCRACKSYLNAYRLTKDLSKKAFSADAKDLPEMPEALTKAILEAQKRQEAN